MKFGYAIVLALVALVAVTGFASADRLPQQVPENQIFTIDTLIDVTGAVSQESEMQWTIDSQNSVAEGVIFDNNNFDALAGNAVVLTPAQLNYLQTKATEWANLYGNAASDYLSYKNIGGVFYLTKLNVPVDVNTNYMDPELFGSTTYANYLAYIEANFNYADSTVKIPGAIHDSKLYAGEEIAILTWTDTLRSNGGKLALNENIDFDSRNKGKGLNNLEVEKVLTYASTEGAHLVGAEEWTLDVAGNWEKTADSIRCVFAAASTEYFPAFCNVVKAKSELVNINSAQVSTKGAARAVAATGDIPAALNYQIAVTPDSNSGSGFADGTVKTLFGGSIMEARGKNQVPSATNNWKDTASVTGGIKNFQKTFNYESGFTF
ncbi:hypothetical protein Mhun_2271 [Methanospirillum hungatei JF-1]|uniref:Uncharacterized protein n=1 Tax=Methanospirillum hungatei JF-1 (strain ATCC 27890 / DSM 864 / NBRC 100397 / JF-1) TaxID=323259 RepID=Q2FRN9_METHJ|nr:hypothetical protein [Methanospirillum hungatei]ABD41976.1 hypothetical protein Mhun_2271 [Methanospirillum hungatei JF-1]